MELISINEAASQGISLLRLPAWVCECAHLKIDLIDGKPGPWSHLYDPVNLLVNGKDPMNILFTEMDYTAKSWLVHTGPVFDSDEYKAKQAAYSAHLEDKYE